MLSCLPVAYNVKAQSKVFKEVNDEISSQTRSIIQDNVLVGYLVFSQLEKASEDSFNYKVLIMDENLNDIGTVNFRDIGLNLQGVAFEQDVLCMAYLSSNIAGQVFSSNRKYKKVIENANNTIVTQFLNLEGKIIKRNAYKVDIKMEPTGYSKYPGKFTATERLEHSLQLTNIPQKGFACFYGDKNNNKLLVFDATGKELWQKKVEDAQAFSLMTSKEDIYILTKKKEKMLEGGFQLLGYGFKEGTNYKKHILMDKDGNSLKVLSFGNDPISGKPYLSGNIISSSNGNRFSTGKQMTKGTYSGVFAINFNGHKPGEINEVYSYWDDGSKKPEISRKAFYTDNNSYAKYTESMRDYQGNTYFAGSGFIKKPKWGAIGAAVILSPLIVVSPFILATTGTNKIKVVDAVLVKQSPKGVLSYENTIQCENSKFFQARNDFSYFDKNTFYHLANSINKSNYLVVDDKKNIVIYNISQKKVARTIPHKDGNIRTNVFPAKEGYIMVSEYNKKEKFTRLSIESI